MTKPHFPPIFFLSLLSPLTSSHPHASPLSTRGAPTLQGTCPTTSLPTESQYTLGYQSFCDTYIPSSSSILITESAPLVATFDLSTHYNNPIKWIYKISVKDSTPLTPVLEISREGCVGMFRRLLEGDDGSDYSGMVGGGGEGEGKSVVEGGGRLRENYCVVEGTGGDKEGEQGMSGEGVVLVLGGQVTVKGVGERGFASVVFESRERGG